MWPYMQPWDCTDHSDVAESKIVLALLLMSSSQTYSWWGMNCCSSPLTLLNGSLRLEDTAVAITF